MITADGGGSPEADIALFASVYVSARRASSATSKLCGC
jgi:hypothetical protein